MFDFNSKVPQHIQDINILMVVSQWEGRGRLGCTSSVYKVPTKRLSERVRLSVGEKEREKNHSDDRRQAATTL